MAKVDGTIGIGQGAGNKNLARRGVVWRMGHRVKPVEFIWRESRRWPGRKKGGEL
jgi:hypothetical protein